MKNWRPLKPFRTAIWNGERWTGTPPRPKPRKPMKRGNSHKRKKLDKVYEQQRKWFLARPENSLCPVAAKGLIPDLHGNKVPHHRAALTVHHAWKRGRYYLDETTWLSASWDGHCWIEMNKAEARRLGWLCDTAETRERWATERKLSHLLEITA